VLSELRSLERGDNALVDVAFYGEAPTQAKAGRGGASGGKVVDCDSEDEHALAPAELKVRRCLTLLLIPQENPCC